jgi:hypothetical protein
MVDGNRFNDYSVFFWFFDKVLNETRSLRHFIFLHLKQKGFFELESSEENKNQTGH